MPKVRQVTYIIEFELPVGTAGGLSYVKSTFELNEPETEVELWDRVLSAIQRQRDDAAFRQA